MFRESAVDSALNRLSGSLGSRLIVHPPASAETIAHLEKLAGVLPREFHIFLSTCNGLRVRDGGRDMQICGTGEIEALLPAGGAGLPDRLVPVRGEPVGERDWVVCGPGPAEGAVIRWDPWRSDAELVAASFGAYLWAWVRGVIAHSSFELPDAGSDRRSFNPRALTPHDPEMEILSRDPEVSAWLTELGHAVACGDDFE